MPLRMAASLPATAPAPTWPWAAVVAGPGPADPMSDQRGDHHGANYGRSAITRCHETAAGW